MASIGLVFTLLTSGTGNGYVFILHHLVQNPLNVYGSHPYCSYDMQQPSCSTCGLLLHFEHGFDAHARMVRLPSRIRSSTFTFLRFQLVVNIVDILPPVYTSRTYAKAYIPITINVVNITTAPFLVIYPPAACSCKRGTNTLDREVGFPAMFERRRC